MRHLRPLVLGPLLALLVAGCGVVDDALPDGPDATATATATATPGASAGGDGPDGGDDPQVPDGPTTSAETPAPDDGTGGDGDGDGDADGLAAVDDRGPVGSNAAAYLRAGRDRLVIEVDVAPGVSLPQGVLEHLRAEVGSVTALPVDVVTGVLDSARTDWTTSDLRAAADSFRDERSSDTQAAVYLAVVEGEFADGDGVLGLAHTASETVLFPDQVAGLGALLNGTAVLRAVAVHELGHVLGLVGLFEDPVNDHEDGEHPGHTTDRDDVMFWAVETDLIGTVFNGPPPDEFGPFSLADLEAIREG